MDFAANNDDDYAKLKALVDSLDVAILINNVGASHSIPVPFTQTDRSEVKSIITINCMATLRVTQLVAAGMVQRKRGLILTMGSFYRPRLRTGALQRPRRTGSILPRHFGYVENPQVQRHGAEPKGVRQKRAG